MLVRCIEGIEVSRGYTDAMMTMGYIRAYLDIIIYTPYSVYAKDIVTKGNVPCI